MSVRYILIILLLTGSNVTKGQNYFATGISTAEFDYVRAQTVNDGLQVQSNWCWAACVQMVLNYHGLVVNQFDVVTRIYGSPDHDQPANTQQILYALSGWAPNVYGSNSYITAYAGYTSVTAIIQALSGKWPLIVGMRNPDREVGHAYVLTAIFYYVQYDIYGNITAYIPDKVVLRDPWPGSISRQELSWNEFQSRCMMAIQVAVSR